MFEFNTPKNKGIPELETSAKKRPAKSILFTSTPCSSKHASVSDFKHFAISDCSGFDSDDSLFQDNTRLKAFEEEIISAKVSKIKEVDPSNNISKSCSTVIDGKQSYSPELFPKEPNKFISSTPKRSALANISTNSKCNENVSPSMFDHSFPGVAQGNRSVFSQINKQLKHNSFKSAESSLAFPEIRTNCIQNALDEARTIQNQISQSDIGPFYGLPSRVAFLFKTFRGIDSLYDWQDECLKLPVIGQRRNLIYTLPTSGGKTLVAEILMLRELLCHGKDAIFVLPYVSLVQEKLRSLAPFAVELDFVVAEYASSKGVLPPRKKRRRHTIYVCTIEKSHMLVNSLIEVQRLDEIGILVADELHMIGEKGGRGAVFECLLAKVLYMQKDIQIIGMSATLSNMNDLKRFLQAEVFERNFRPVELREYVKVNHQLFEFGSSKDELPLFVRDVKFDYYTPEMLKLDPDGITGLVLEVVPQNSCLIFCPTKKHCENVAVMLTKVLPQELKKHKLEERLVLYNSLASEGEGHICKVLAQTVKFGVAYHHSGLTSDERKLIEEAYISGTLCCLTCTSTLAAGVNLPAKRVILRAPYIAKDFISFSRYKQMVGRAGRAGIDSSGESILMIKPGEEIKVQLLLSSDADACESSLLIDPGHIQMLLLSSIGIGIVTSLQEIENFIRHTLAYAQCNDTTKISKLCDDTVKSLIEWGLIEKCANATNKLKATILGIAAFKGGIEASEAQELYSSLKKGLEAVALSSYLHLLFMVTPSDFTQQVRFNGDTCFQCYSDLNAEDQAVANLIGVTEGMIMVAASGRTLSKERQQLLHRFYITLMLYDLWKQKQIWHVAEKYEVNRGIVQNLLSSSSAFGSTLVYFCEEFEIFWAFNALLPNFVKRLAYCVTADLFPLMELPAVKIGRARQLYSAGFKSVTHLARTNPTELVMKVKHMSYRVATQIISAAKMMLIEKIEALKEEADLLTGDDLHCSVLFDTQVDAQLSFSS